MRGVEGGLGIGVNLRILDILRILNILSTSQTDPSFSSPPDSSKKPRMLAQSTGIEIAKTIGAIIYYLMISRKLHAFHFSTS